MFKNKENLPLDYIISVQPDLLKITPKLLEDIYYSKLGTKLNFNKTWSENGFDELDSVEFLMHINISDIFAESLFGMYSKPPQFKQHIRNEKLYQLGIK